MVDWKNCAGLPLAWLAATFIALAASAVGVRAEVCEPNAHTDAFHVERLELAAGQGATIAMPPGWVLAFKPAPHGWLARVRDGNGLDLSQITPPLHGPNSRDLFGWHFRNAANTGPNTGDVNAPQHVRDLLFAPALVGTGGYKSSDGGLSPGGDIAVARLVLSDLRLTPPTPGETAAFTGVTVEACIRWPREAVRTVSAGGVVPALADCGLDLSVWQSQATLEPATLSGDLDGDGTDEVAAMVVDGRSGESAIAVCRSGEITMLAEDGPGLPDGLLPSVEQWRIVPRDHGSFGYVDEPPWPTADGDLIALERIEKSLDLVYLSQGNWRSLRIFGVVTE